MQSVDELILFVSYRAVGGDSARYKQIGRGFAYFVSQRFSFLSLSVSVLITFSSLSPSPLSPGKYQRSGIVFFPRYLHFLLRSRLFFSAHREREREREKTNGVYKNPHRSFLSLSESTKRFFFLLVLRDG